MTHWKGGKPHKGLTVLSQKIALYQLTSQRIGAIQHYNSYTCFGAGLYGQIESPDECVYAAADVLKVNNKKVDFGQLPRRRLSVFSIETKDRDIKGRIKIIRRLLHIVLLFSIKAVLRAKKALQMAWQHGKYQIFGVS
jgi:hypothetical protein